MHFISHRHLVGLLIYTHTQTLNLPFQLKWIHTPFSHLSQTDKHRVDSAHTPHHHQAEHQIGVLYRKSHSDTWRYRVRTIVPIRVINALLQALRSLSVFTGNQSRWLTVKECRCPNWEKAELLPLTLLLCISLYDRNRGCRALFTHIHGHIWYLRQMGWPLRFFFSFIAFQSWAKWIWESQSETFKGILFTQLLYTYSDYMAKIIFLKANRTMNKPYILSSITTTAITPSWPRVFSHHCVSVKHKLVSTFGVAVGFSKKHEQLHFLAEKKWVRGDLCGFFMIFTLQYDFEKPHPTQNWNDLDQINDVGISGSICWRNNKSWIVAIFLPTMKPIFTLRSLSSC